MSAEPDKHEPYIRVTERARPKTAPTDTAIYLKMPIVDYLELDEMAERRDKSVDEVLLDLIQDHIRIQHSNPRTSYGVVRRAAARYSIRWTEAKIPLEGEPLA
ncbi:MAG: hypothetical protein ACR2JC_00545 [Chloroflexota bacterium]|nr:MAG: hypothetical protein DLM70_14110 [Chloroflexota bacterium]